MPCIAPIDKKPKGYTRTLALPCGKCPVCKKNRVRKWIFRLQQEEKVSSSSYFVTLTYDTAKVPISETGRLTLRKKDFQDFMKRLRKYNGETKIKYYACGEYGEKYHRPHYHVILFNIKSIEDINRAWNNGSIDIGDANPNSIAYTVKYIDKETRIPQYKGDDRQKEFSLMSKGIGKSYVTEEIKKYHQADVNRNYITTYDGYKIPMPRYYRDLIYTDQQKEQQRRNINIQKEEKRKKNYQRYLTLYGEKPNFTFEAYLGTLKSAQYKKFYSKSLKKPRL